MTKNIIAMTPSGQAKFILFFGVGLTLVIFYGLTNHFQGVQIVSSPNNWTIQKYNFNLNIF